MEYGKWIQIPFVASGSSKDRIHFFIMVQYFQIIIDLFRVFDVIVDVVVL